MPKSERSQCTEKDALSQRYEYKRNFFASLCFEQRWFRTSFGCVPALHVRSINLLALPLTSYHPPFFHSVPYPCAQMQAISVAEILKHRVGFGANGSYDRIRADYFANHVS